MNLLRAVTSIYEIVHLHYPSFVSVYIFGSSLINFSKANDIDVLVVGKDVNGTLLRREFKTLDLFIPVHLVVLSHDEENELQFIKGVGALPLQFIIEYLCD